MVIDIHAHVFGERRWAPEGFWQPYRRILAANLGSTLEEIEREVLPSLWDADGSRIIAEMDAAGIERAVVLCLDWGLVGETLAVEELHERHAALVARHKDRLLFGVGVDPRRPDAERLLVRAVRQLGARLLKLYPPAGFYPNEEQLYPLYRRCQAEGIPVLLHVGPAVAPFRSKYSHPLHLDDVAADFPEVNIIMAHAGHGWWRDALAIARSKHNLWLDFSGWGLLAHLPQRVLEPLRELLDVVPGRVLFGTDYIGLKGSMGRPLSLLRQPPSPGPIFTEREMADFLGGSAARLLRL